MLTSHAFLTACAHSFGCKADRTKIMIATSTVPAGNVGGRPEVDERSQTAEVTNFGSYFTFDCEREYECRDLARLLPQSRSPGVTSSP